jgi:hypothetical protein
MSTHTGINATETNIYLVQSTTVTPNPRRADGVSFSITRESFTNRDDAQSAYCAAKRDAGESTEVALKVKRPGSKSFVEGRPGELTGPALFV